MYSTPIIICLSWPLYKAMSHIKVICADSILAPNSVLTRPEHIQAVFKASNKHFKAVDNNSGYFLSQILGKCVGLISRDEWRTVRAITEKPFLRSTSTSYVSIVER